MFHPFHVNNLMGGNVQEKVIDTVITDDNTNNLLRLFLAQTCLLNY